MIYNESILLEIVVENIAVALSLSFDISAHVNVLSRAGAAC